MKKSVFFFLFFILSFSLFSQNTATIIKNSLDVRISRMSILNSTYRETNLSITPDGKYLYFMTDRGGQSWSYLAGTYKGKPRYDGDIWFSEKVGGAWSSPQCLDANINTYSGEDEPNITPDGQRVYYQSWRYGYETSGGPYYTAKLSGNVWGKSFGLGGGINKFFCDKISKTGYYATDGMSMSPNSDLFIVACGEDYEGNMDLFYSRKEDGEWTYCKKLELSTDGDERSVFIAPDGKTIYFASDGYGGYGGLDIFKADLDSYGNCSNIQNLGVPFNTAGDDYGFIITADGLECYFVRDEDIFYGKLPEDSPVAPGASVIITGNIVGCDNNAMEIELLLQNKDKSVISSCKSSKNGVFLFSIPETSEELRIVDKRGVLIKNIKVTKTGQFQKIIIDLKYCNRTDEIHGAKKPD